MKKGEQENQEENRRDKTNENPGEIIKIRRKMKIKKHEDQEKKIKTGRKWGHIKTRRTRKSGRKWGHMKVRRTRK